MLTAISYAMVYGETIKKLGVWQAWYVC